MERAIRYLQIGQPGPEVTLDHYVRLEENVVSIDPAESGFVVSLDCGHEIWVPRDPGGNMWCGPCMEEIIADLPGGAL
jgi:hypothetical protein